MLESQGKVYRGTREPEISRADDGTFQLTLSLVDNLGGNLKQLWRVRWSGPEAQAFWEAHKKDLQSGANVLAELTHIHVHVGATFPPKPELRARIVSLEYCPKRHPAPPAPPTNPSRYATA